MAVTTGALPDVTFWSGKRVLLTGHTGFKGSWTALWLASMGAKVTGFALAPDTEPALFHLAQVEQGIVSVIGDLRNPAAVDAVVDTADPQIVLHMGAQALVLRSINDPVGTFASNVQGTVHLLDALRRRRDLTALLVVTSDKVYANDGYGRSFTEDDPLGGRDPYSASKAATEIVVKSFAQSFFERAGVPLATARGGNVVGGGDFSANRLVPDIIRAAKANEPLVLRHPAATRPWQHVLDCVNGYLLFMEALAGGRTESRALNFAPTASEQVTVAVLADAMLRALGREPSWDFMPEPNSIETEMLALDASAAGVQLGWHSRLSVESAVRWTADWYRAYVRGEEVRALTLEQIAAYGEA